MRQEVAYMKKQGKPAPELELVENLEPEQDYQEMQKAAENKVRDELKAQNDVIRRGMVVQMVDVTKMIDEPGYFLVKGQIMTDINGVPLFTEIIMKMTKHCISKFVTDARIILKNAEEDKGHD
jgi:hypothetical protein